MEYELTIEALADLPEERYALFDIRDEISFEYGTIPGAENAPDILSRAGNGLLPRAKKPVLFCILSLLQLAKQAV